MSEKVITAGDEVDSYCTTCKIVLAHRVVAVVDDKPEKVICKTCEKKHKYRPNPPKSRAKKAATGAKKTSRKTTTAKKKTTRTRKTKDPTVVWEEALADKNISNAKMYSMGDVFDQDDIIEHDKFGHGLVKEIHAEGKMEVLFKEGTKLLVFGRERH